MKSHVLPLALALLVAAAGTAEASRGCGRVTRHGDGHRSDASWRHRCGPDCSHPRDGHYRDGRYRDGRYRDGRYRDGRYRDGRYRDGRYRSYRHDDGYRRGDSCGHVARGRCDRCRGRQRDSDFRRSLDLIHFVLHVVDDHRYRSYDCGCRHELRRGHREVSWHAGRRHVAWVPDRWVPVRTCRHH